MEKWEELAFRMKITPEIKEAYKVVKEHRSSFRALTKEIEEAFLPILEELRYHPDYLPSIRVHHANAPSVKIYFEGFKTMVVRAVVKPNLPMYWEVYAGAGAETWSRKEKGKVPIARVATLREVVDVIKGYLATSVVMDA